MAAHNILPDRIAGPAWLQTERYDIAAKRPPETTGDQCNEMPRSLLTEKFHMTLHLDSKEAQGYELTVGKDGSKLKENTTGAPPSTGPQARLVSMGTAFRKPSGPGCSSR